MPGPLVLLDRMITVYGDPASYLVVWVTLVRIFEGLVICMIIGTALGLAMGLERNVEAFFDSWVMVLLTFPAVCWAFLSVLWSGLSDIGPILVVVLIVFPFVTMNIWEGTKAVEKELVDMATVYKADRSLMVRIIGDWPDSCRRADRLPLCHDEHMGGHQGGGEGIGRYGDGI